MIEAIIEAYWAFFGIGEGTGIDAAILAAILSFLMLCALPLNCVRFFQGKIPFFLLIAHTIIALSYASTDIVMASLTSFYKNFDDTLQFVSISLSYTILDSLTAIAVMVSSRKMNCYKSTYNKAIDLMVLILLINGAAHFLMTAYNVVASDFSTLIAMFYSALIVFNDALLVTVMFMPLLANKLKPLKRFNIT